MPSITGTLTSSGDSAALITPASNQFIEVWSLSIIGKDTDATVTVKTGSTAKYTVPTPEVGTGGACPTGAKEPLFQGANGESLKINLSAGGEVAYNIAYAIK